MGSGGVDLKPSRVLREHNYTYWVDMDYDAARKEEGRWSSKWPPTRVTCATN